MNDRPYAVARLDEVPAFERAGRTFAPLRHHFGIRAFGVTAWTAHEAGTLLIDEHSERDGDEELYVVTSGRATFTVAGEDVDAPAGTLVFVRPDTVRAAVAQEPETTVIAIGGKPGQAFRVSAWELWSPAYQAGEYERAIEALAGVLDEYPDDAGLLYNLACCESLGGRRRDALEHLRRAVELEARFREYAEADPDLDPIRDDSAFAAVVGGET